MNEIKINTTKIKHLIDEYFEGRTSSEEEQLLRNYFAQKDIDPKLKGYQPLFAAMKTLYSQPELLQKETLDTTSLSHNIFTRRKLLAITTIAASVAAVFFIVILNYKPLISKDYVIIDGVKYTDNQSIETAMNASLQNVKINMNDIFTDLDDLNLE